MTRLLEKAFAEASKLSENEQEGIAECLLEELASEQRWRWRHSLALRTHSTDWRMRHLQSFVKVYEIVWPEYQVDHIALHGIIPEEVEEARFGKPNGQPKDSPN